VTSASGDEPGRTQPGDQGTVPDVTTQCGGGCGPIGLAPVLLTMLGIGGLRRWRNRLCR
jgi:hypothetical protein